ncbi:tetratricopeptide repeat protein [Azospirillum sp.]|uniref:tetratricopeptide repeat protein n=1 Tax=Azospirillum sp. TaxID=34012 RepID=UPI003D74C7EF
MRKTPRTSWILAGVVVAVTAVGSFILGLTSEDRGVVVEAPPAPASAPAPASGPAPAAAPAPGDDAFRDHFTAGVEYLRQGRPHEALVSFNAASHLRPHVPEVFVNIGFAQATMGKHGDAAEAFDRALQIKPDQTNAYFGLAVALEGMGRLEEALGAMRTFEHLTPREDEKFRVLAASAIWEWSATLEARRAEARPPDAEPKEGN